MSEEVVGLGEYHASPAAADGMVSLANVEGKITVQKASVSGRVLGSATSATKSIPRQNWGGGRLYVPTLVAIYCFGVK